MSQQSPTTGRVARERFGTTPAGEAVEAFTLENAAGARLQVLTFGAVVRSLLVPDAAGRLADVVLGYDTLDAYRADGFYLGALIGRHANRIAYGRFELNGERYQLAQNNGPHNLHSGPRGFDKVVWQAEVVERLGAPALALRYTSPDGDQGFPGTLRARVVYTLTAANELVVEYAATTDRATPVNLTQHSYFNLAGAGRGDVLAHRLTLHADAFTPVDETAIPAGSVAAVQGTPLDFTRPRAIGERLHDDHPQLRNAQGYDHNFVLRGEPGTLRLAAHVHEPTSGRTLEVLTTEPGVQFYSGNFLDGTPGKDGIPYARHAGFCLETQHFPDSLHHPEFPSVVLRPGERYASATVFRFATADGLTG